MNERLTATAVAHSNIALVKYWGKLDNVRQLSGGSKPVADTRRF